MAKDYGINFCKEGIRRLEEIENEMFRTLGHGFDMLSQEYQQLCQFETWLKKFQKEKDFGLTPTYDSGIHGRFNE